jgi:hypothetical protein
MKFGTVVRNDLLDGFAFAKDVIVACNRMFFRIDFEYIKSPVDRRFHMPIIPEL